MGLFGGFGRKKDIVNRLLEDAVSEITGVKTGPTIADEVKMIFTDTETAGKKQGYEKAACEYKSVFKNIKTEYNKTKELIESYLNSYGVKSESLILRLSALEEQTRELKKQVANKTINISNKYNIPVEQVRSALEGTSYVTDSSTSIDFLDVIYNYKALQLKKAEQAGYIEAKKLYIEKIEKMKCELLRLQNNGNTDIQNLIALISETHYAIATEQMKIAELKILL